MLDREGIIRRALKELRDGYTVNLGIGMPTLIANHIPAGMEVIAGYRPIATQETGLKSILRLAGRSIICKSIK